MSTPKSGKKKPKKEPVAPVEEPTPEAAALPAAEPAEDETPAVPELPAAPAVELATPCDHHLLDDMWQDGDKRWLIRTRCTKCGYIGEETPREKAVTRLLPPDFARL